MFRANVPLLGLWNLDAFFLIPVQINGDFIAVMLSCFFRHAIEQQ